MTIDDVGGKPRKVGLSKFSIFVFLEFVLSSVCFIVIVLVLLCLSDQLIIVVTWVNLMGWAGQGQCTDLASWPLNKMYMLLLVVSDFLQTNPSWFSRY